MIPGLDGAQLGRLIVQQNRIDAEIAKQLQHVAPGFADEDIREEVPVSDDYSESHSLHCDLQDYLRSNTPYWSALAGVTSSQSIDCFSCTPVDPAVKNLCAWSTANRAISAAGCRTVAFIAPALMDAIASGLPSRPTTMTLSSPA